jgi:ferredoxin
MEPPQRLRVNPIACDGVGYCAEIVPELIFLDDWGFPVVDAGPITNDAVMRHARRAVATCPRLALLLTEQEEAPTARTTSRNSPTLTVAEATGAIHPPRAHSGEQSMH